MRLEEIVSEFEWTLLVKTGTDIHNCSQSDKNKENMPGVWEKMLRVSKIGSMTIPQLEGMLIGLLVTTTLCKNDLSQKATDYFAHTAAVVGYQLHTLGHSPYPVDLSKDISKDALNYVMGEMLHRMGRSTDGK